MSDEEVKTARVKGSRPGFQTTKRQLVTGQWDTRIE